MYTVRHNPRPPGGRRLHWEIVDNSTGRVVGRCWSEEQARDYCDQLNTHGYVEIDPADAELD